MKRSLSFLAMLLLMSPFMHLHGQSGLRPRGDVNRDWEVSVADVNRLTDAIIAGTPYHSFYTYDLDINGDKEINIADVNMLVDALLGTELAPMPSFSGTLPVLYINTEGHRDITSKEEYLHADWWLDAMGIEGYESLGSAVHPLGMQIRGRGNYTWTLNKKPFRIKLDTKQKVLGMKSNRHFCLMAHASWNDFLTNTVGFELSRRIGLAYTPAQVPVEVVLNGQYIGLYFLTEKIVVGENRVNIKEQENGDTCKANITREARITFRAAEHIVQKSVFCLIETKDAFLTAEAVVWRRKRRGLRPNPFATRSGFDYPTHLPLKRTSP